ncbi:MAG: hypothetical protein WBN08_17495 [Thiogranum sp.]
MNWMLFVLSAVTGVSGTVILILSVFMDNENLLNAGLLSLLITALLMIGIVITRDRGHGGNT